jgi:hypothetical protein
MMGNPLQCAEVVECGERIPATSSKEFDHSEGTYKFEPTEFQNPRHECGNVGLNTEPLQQMVVGTK